MFSAEYSNIIQFYFRREKAPSNSLQNCIPAVRRESYESYYRMSFTRRL